MRLLFVLHGYPPDEAAGTELYAEAVATELDDLGHEVHVFAASPAAPEGTHRTDRRDGVTVERFRGDARPEPDGTAPLRDPEAETAFAATLERVRPDVVVVISTLSLSPRIVELARAVAPTVVAPTDFSFVCPATHIPVGRRHRLRGRWWGLSCFAHTEASNPRWLASLLRRRRLAARVRWHLERARLGREALRRADLVLTPSEFVRSVFVDFGVDPSRIEALSLGLESDGAPPERTRGASGPTIGYLGAFVRDKGADLLLRAFRGVEAADARLILRGRAEDPAYRASLVRTAGDDPRIEIAEAVEAGGVLEFLATLDLLVVPTRVHESFSRVAREAFLVGVPVLAARAGALPEIVTPGRNGALFDAGDEGQLRQALQELFRPGALESLHDFPAIKTMRDHANELVERFERLAA